MGFIDDQHDPSAAFVFFSGEQTLRLSNQLGLEAARHRAQCLDDRHVQAASADGWVGQVHDVMCGLIQLANDSAHRDGLADADLAGDHPNNDSAMQKRMRATAS